MGGKTAIINSGLSVRTIVAAEDNRLKKDYVNGGWFSKLEIAKVIDCDENIVLNYFKGPDGVDSELWKLIVLSKRGFGGTPYSTLNRAVLDMTYKYHKIITEGQLSKIAEEYGLLRKKGDKMVLFDTTLKLAVDAGLFEMHTKD